MGIVGLIGGVVIESIAKARTQNEVVSIFGLVKIASVKAFSTGADVGLNFNDDEVKVSFSDGVIKEKKYDYVRFDNQSLLINRNGGLDSNSIAVQVNGEEQILDFTSIIFGRSLQDGAHNAQD